ncbi:MAG: tetratricopeptide (TPR) repeat protein [Myxococcota bacterium]|jgi:tetratricopeptide (TPR) repeat protein
MGEEQLLRQAAIYIDRGQYPHAERMLCRLLGVNPGHSEAHALLALMLVQQKRLDAATVEAEIAVSQDPEEPLAHGALFEIAVAELRFADAESHIDRLLMLDPYNPGAFHKRANLRQLQNREDDALADLDQALHIAPTDQSAMAMRGRILLARGDIDGAEVEARRALALGAEHTGALVLMGHILLKRGDIAAARDHAISALRNNVVGSGPIHLLTAVKARESWTLGLWWRWQSWMSSRGQNQVILILVGAYIVFRLITIRLEQLDYDNARFAINIAWLGLIAYTWTAPVLWNRMLRKELKPVQLRGF